MSSKTQNRLRLYNEIQKHGTPCEVACDYCFWNNKTCIAMSSSSSNTLKCSECVRRGRPCANLSWASLDQTRSDLQKKIDEDEQLLAEAMARLLRNKKILKQAEERAKQKAQCLLSEMDEARELEDEDCPAVAATVGLSPLVWQSLGSLEAITNGEGLAL